MTTTDREYFDTRFDGMKEYVDTRLDGMKGYVDGRFDEMKGLIDVRFAELKAELHQTISQTVKWAAGIASATLVLFVTLVAFVMNNSVPRSAPAAAQASQAPIVIVIPPNALVQASKP
jgi:hypothetical protein